MVSAIETSIHKTVQLKHGKTRYIDVGTGHPLILLHLSSIESGADDCLATLGVLAPTFRVLAPDLLGFPPSDTLDGIDAFPFLVDFLREFQDALGIKAATSSARRWEAGSPDSSRMRVHTDAAGSSSAATRSPAHRTAACSISPSIR